ncbi:sensor histidine kinase inhibitor, KipI family [Poseidonocella pacifica]|uniref:Sensor histidine kinase inhibitor, KipI family n=1 Tax=Poseidonocella pacifica TaxID=871651 RepID=A0A1I0YEJ4_9RHOB|nr:carboxyltransferase domain-containing protein [Poseidonocella pacifica]SFB11631.1 sensor histidine kinase inhibitor, KipI family [Poseidonocella pacifica]
MSDRGPEVLPLGHDGLVVRFALHLSEAANDAVLGFAEAARVANVPGLLEVVPALASVYLRYDPARGEAFGKDVSDLLETDDWYSRGRPPAKRCWEIPCSFEAADAPELGAVARATSQTPDAAIAEVLATEVRVLAIGFAPGQPYLGLLPPAWDQPRRRELTEVPAGALVTALRQLVLFANPSPTGWKQIGRTAFRPFQGDRDDPVALRTGDAVRFIRVDGATLAGIEERDHSGLGGAKLVERS